MEPPVAKHLRRIYQAVPFVLACGARRNSANLLVSMKTSPPKSRKAFLCQPNMLEGTWYTLAVLPQRGLLIAGAGICAIRRKRMA